MISLFSLFESLIRSVNFKSNSKFYIYRRANRSLADPERAAKKMNISKDSEHGSPQGNYWNDLMIF